MSRVVSWSMPNAKLQISRRLLPNDYFRPSPHNRRMLSEHEWQRNKVAAPSIKRLYIRTDSGISTSLSQIYELCRHGNTEGALDKILDAVDGFLASDRLHRCDEMLRSVNVDLLDIPSVLGFLSATYVVRKKLRARGDFYNAARIRIARERSGDVDRLITRFQ